MDVEEASTGYDPLLATLERLLELNVTELNAALDQASAVVAEALGADAVDVFLYDPAKGGFLPHGRTAPPAIAGGAATQAFPSGAAHGGAAPGDPGELLALGHGLTVRSAIAAPLSLGAGVQGLLVAGSAKPNRFSEQDLRVLETTARWIGRLAQTAEWAEQRWRAAAEELLTVAAHDVSNYLTPLIGRIELLRRRASREDSQAYLRDAEELARSARHIHQLVADVLDTKRLEHGLFSLIPRPVDLAALARELAGTFATGDVPIHVQAEETVVVAADASRMRQALANLLANAVKHSPRVRPWSWRWPARRDRTRAGP